MFSGKKGGMELTALLALPFYLSLLTLILVSLAAQRKLAVEQIPTDGEVHGDAQHEKGASEVCQTVGGALGVEHGGVANALGKKAGLLRLASLCVRSCVLHCDAYTDVKGREKRCQKAKKKSTIARRRSRCELVKDGNV